MSRTLYLISGVLAAFLLAILPWLIWRTPLPLEIDPNEAWNGWWARAVANGQPLYPDSQSLIINNYPPLSFYLLNLASRFAGGDVIVAGRILSLVAALVISVNIHSLLRVFWRLARLPALLAAMWFAALLLTYFARYTGMNDPQLPALALMTAGLRLLLTSTTTQRFVAATALIVAAGFLKHSLWAIPLAVFAYFAFTSRSRAVLFAAAGAGFALAGLALCYAIWGPDFINQLLLPRASSWQNGVRHLPNMLWFYPAAAFSLLSFFRGERSQPRLLAHLLLWSAFAVDIIQRRGAGVDISAELELAFAAAIWMGLAASRLGNQPLSRPASTVHILLFIVPLAAAMPLDTFKFYFPEWRREMSQRVNIVDDEIERVARIKGNVACDRASVCFRAGKANVYDVFAARQRLALGHWSEQRMRQAIASAGVTFVKIDPRVAW